MRVAVAVDLAVAFEQPPTAGNEQAKGHRPRLAGVLS